MLMNVQPPTTRSSSVFVGVYAEQSIRTEVGIGAAASEAAVTAPHSVPPLPLDPSDAKLARFGSSASVLKCPGGVPVDARGRELEPIVARRVAPTKFISPSNKG